MKDVCVTIPAYNEAETIAAVIQDCQNALDGTEYDYEILVINDGSQDDTAAIAEDAGATVVSHDVNQGLGVTFKTALREAIKTDAAIIVNIDADGQYEAAELPDVIEPVADGCADLSLGVRSVFSLDHMPLGKKVGNKIGSLVTSMLSGQHIIDAQSGFRAFSRELALRTHLFGTYTYVQETLIQAAHKDFTIEQVPITFYARDDGESRLISSLRQYIKNAASIVIRTYRDHQPMKTFGTIAAAFFLLAAVPAYQILDTFLATGMFDLQGRGLLVVLLTLGGALTLIFGLLADMLKAQRDLMEEILYELRTGE